ncbi:MAG TPA: FkbM family methyltransferase [Ferruginibacter sp.]|nr:FkbM family methyltransferase [Ferruginibacter sp.]HMP21253.1 FkbM family methyltransferase [Ferruginibacter sp.]
MSSIASIFRKLPEFRGKQRLARLLLRNSIATHRDIIIPGRYDCVYKVPNVKESIGFELFINGVYEDDIIRFIASRISPDTLFIDTGANIGAITLPLLKLHPGLRVICIEASARVYSYLQWNIDNANTTACTLVHAAVSDIDGNTVSFFSPDEKFGKGSMSSVFTKKAEQVPTVRLDTLVAQQGWEGSSFIKVDIEGYEYYAFSGAQRLLYGENAPDILFEFVDWAENAAAGLKTGAAQQLLLEYGYTLYRLHDGDLQNMKGTVLTTGYAMIFATKKKMDV